MIEATLKNTMFFGAGSLLIRDDSANLLKSVNGDISEYSPDISNITRFAGGAKKQK
jgi:hypothetical protein